MAPAAIFPSQMFSPRDVDDAFVEQEAAARRAGFDVAVVDQEHLDQGSCARATRSIEHQGLAVYRGWMLTVERYTQFYAALVERGVSLINTPEQYRNCHHLPESFDSIAARSPATVWVPLGPDGVDLDEVIEAARGFGDAPVVVKDYVKSRKHEWEEACFVPSAADEDRLRAVVSTFVDRQGDLLTGGVVIRELVELQSVGSHPKSGMPLTREHRVFVLDGKPLVTGRYWSNAQYAEDDVPLEEFSEIMQAVQSRFFTMDLALGCDGAWRIIELGDGQVAGLLDTIAPSTFFERLQQRLRA